MGTQTDIRDQRYRTEPDIGTSDNGLKCAESDIISISEQIFVPYAMSDIKFFKPSERSGKILNSEHDGYGFENTEIKNYQQEFTWAI